MSQAFKLIDSFEHEWVPTGQLRMVPLANLPPRTSLRSVSLADVRLQQEFRCITKQQDTMWRDVPIRKE